MSKIDNNEVEMIVEAGGEQQPQVSPVQAEAETETETVLQDTLQADAPLKSEESESARALKRMKESASEDDDAPIGSLSLKQILGGDYLFAMVRHHIALIIVIVFFLIFYIGVRYQCEQDVLEINQLEKDLVDAKYKALSSSSNLTELCRQSNVLKVLRENQDTLLHLSDQPPYIIEVPED